MCHIFSVCHIQGKGKGFIPGSELKHEVHVAIPTVYASSKGEGEEEEFSPSIYITVKKLGSFNPLLLPQFHPFFYVIEQFIFSHDVH